MKILKKEKKGGCIMLKNNKLWLLVTVLLMVTLAGSHAFSKKKASTLRITGSTTVLPIAQLEAEMFMEIHPDINISVRGGGSGVGIAALIDQTADIANSSRPIKTKEKLQCRSKGINPVETVIAKDGIAIVVHPSNPVKELSTEQLKKIYTGEITKWSELNGENKSIVIISRDVSSGTFEVFKKKVLKGAKTKVNALMLASNTAVVTTVANTPYAIGYIGIGYLSSKVKALDIDGVTPTDKTVVSGEYKISRPLYMYTDGKPKALAKEFIDFILSSEGQKIVETAGFVSLK